MDLLTSRNLGATNINFSLHVSERFVQPVFVFVLHEIYAVRYNPKSEIWCISRGGGYLVGKTLIISIRKNRREDKEEETII